MSNLVLTKSSGWLCRTGRFAGGAALLALSAALVPAEVQAVDAPDRLYLAVEKSASNGADLYAPVEMTKEGNVFTSDVVFSTISDYWGNPNVVGLVIKEDMTSSQYWSTNQGMILLDEEKALQNIGWFSPTRVQGAENGATYTVTITFPEDADAPVIHVNKSENQKPVEFEKVIRTIAMRVRGDYGVREFEIPYDAEKEEFAADFLLEHNTVISFVANGETEYRVGSYTNFPPAAMPFTVECKAGNTGDFSTTFDNYGWRHVSAKEVLGNILTATFTEGEPSALTMPSGKLVIAHSDGLADEVDMRYESQSWSAKEIPFVAGDKFYFSFADGTYSYLKDPNGFAYKTSAKGMSMTMGSEVPDLGAMPAVEVPGEFTFVYSYYVNATNNRRELYFTRRDVTFEDPQISVYRQSSGDGASDEFLSLMDFVLLEKHAETILSLKGGEKICLVPYGGVPVKMAVAETFEGSHDVSADGGEWLTVPEDGTYRLRYCLSNTLCSVEVEAVNPFSELWLVKGDAYNFVDYAERLKFRLLPEEGNPAHYVSESPICLSQGEQFFIADSAETPLVGWGSTTNTHGVQATFAAGKATYMARFDIDPALTISEEERAAIGYKSYDVPAVPEKGSVEGYIMYVDFSLSRKPLLKWGETEDNKGENYWLIGNGNPGTVSDGSTVYETPSDSWDTDKYGDKYKFTYHPSKNLYTLTLDELWGYIKIDGCDRDGAAPTGNGDYRYLSFAGNEHVHGVGESYDLFSMYNPDGSLMEYTDEDGAKNSQGWDFYVNDPECADDMVVVDNKYDINRFYYYKDITIVFDPDNNRLWMQSPNKDFEYDPSKDPVDIELPLYVVFVGKRAGGGYEFISSHKMSQSYRLDTEGLPELDLARTEANGGMPPMMHAPSIYGYYSSGDIGGYSPETIDPEGDGWIPTDTDMASTVTVKPGSDKEKENYELVYFFFSETDGEHESRDLSLMLENAPHYVCANEDNVALDEGVYVVDPADSDYVTGEGALAGGVNEMMLKFHNIDFANGIEATAFNLNFSHRSGKEDVGDNIEGIKLFAVDPGNPLFIEFDRSTSVVKSRVVREAKDLWFVAAYKDSEGNLCKMSDKMVQDPENPYYYESSEYIDLSEAVWNEVGNMTKNGYCNFFFSAEDGADLRQTVTKSLNGEGLGDADSDLLFTVDYAGAVAGEAVSNFNLMTHEEHSKKFFDYGYEIGSGEALNYYRVLPYDEDVPESKKLFKVRVWLKGSPVDPTAGEAALSEGGLATTHVQLVSYPEDMLTCMGEIEADSRPAVRVSGNTLVVDGGEAVVVYDMQGRVIWSGAAHTAVTLADGIYIVSVDGTVYKVLV